jgi:hypothetical protein
VATSGHIAEVRAAYVGGGGRVQPGAAIFREPGEWSGWQIFVFVCFALLSFPFPCWWARGKDGK